MFRGIDPEGMVSLAETVERQAHTIRAQMAPALDLLRRSGRSADANSISSIATSTDYWCASSAANLRWRAATIRTGQDTRFNPLPILRARFAAEAVFYLDDVGESFAQWVGTMQESRHRVDDAAASIAAWLHQGLADLDVTNTDLHNIWRTLDALRGEEIDRVIAALSPAQLERWIAEMGHSINGFSQQEKQDVFVMLAADSSGATLGSIHEAIIAVGGTEEALDFGTAIQMRSADKTIVDFVSYAVSADLTSHRYSALAPAVAVAGLDHDTSLDPIARVIINSDSALRLLVIDAAVGADAGQPDTSSALLSTLTRATDSGIRAALFAAVTDLAASPASELDDLIEERTPPGSRSDALQLIQAIRDGLLATATELLVRDPNGVIEELAANVDRGGFITITFWDLLVTENQGGTIARILDSLRGGDHVQADAFSRVGLDPNYRFPHARNLAFAAGTLNTALQRHADKAKNDIDAIVRLAGVVTSAAGLLSGAGDLAGAVLGIGADFGINEVAANHNRNIDRQLQGLIDEVTATLRPANEADATPPVVDGASAAWIDVYLTIMPYA